MCDILYVTNSISSPSFSNKKEIRLTGPIVFQIKLPETNFKRDERVDPEHTSKTILYQTLTMAQ